MRQSAIFKNEGSGELRALPKFFQNDKYHNVPALQGYVYLGIGTFEDFAEKVEQVQEEKPKRTRKPRAKKVVEEVKEVEPENASE